MAKQSVLLILDAVTDIINSLHAQFTQSWFNVIEFNHQSAKLNNLYFHLLKVVSRCRDPQIRVRGNCPNLLNLRLKISVWTLISFPITVI